MGLIVEDLFVGPVRGRAAIDRERSVRRYSRGGGNQVHVAAWVLAALLLQQAPGETLLAGY